MSRMKIRALLLLSVALAGCSAAEGPLYQAAPVTHAKSALYLYLPYTAMPAVTALNFVPPSFIIDCGNFSFQLKTEATADSSLTPALSNALPRIQPSTSRRRQGIIITSGNPSTLRYFTRM